MEKKEPERCSFFWHGLALARQHIENQILRVTNEAFPFCKPACYFPIRRCWAPAQKLVSRLNSWVMSSTYTMVNAGTITSGWPHIGSGREETCMFVRLCRLVQGVQRTRKARRGRREQQIGLTKAEAGTKGGSKVRTDALSPRRTKRQRRRRRKLWQAVAHARARRYFEREQSVWRRPRPGIAAKANSKKLRRRNWAKVGCIKRKKALSANPANRFKGTWVFWRRGTFLICHLFCVHVRKQHLYEGWSRTQNIKGSTRNKGQSNRGRANLQQNRASDLSSCEGMRNLKFVPQPWWPVRAPAPRTAYRSAQCTAPDFASDRDRCDVGHLSLVLFCFLSSSVESRNLYSVMVCVKFLRARLIAKAWETMGVVSCRRCEARG